jgi:bromodomain-containing protein 7
MDFSTIRDKIEQNLYEQFDEFRSDVELITNNAQIYNSPGSLFFLAAQKLATLARYYLSENYLKYLVYSLPFGREVPPEKLGLNLQTRINKEKSRQELQKEREREKMRSMIK